MAKITITEDGLEALRSHAIRAGTLEKWSEMAMEYIRQLNKEFAILVDERTAARIASRRFINPTESGGISASIPTLDAG